MSKKKTFSIICDLDDTVVNLLREWLRQYNKDYSDNLNIRDIRSYDIWKWVKEDCGKDIYSYLNKEGFFSSLEPLDGAIAVLKKLHKDGHDITIVSSPSSAAVSYKDKAAWISKYLPFIGLGNTFLGHKKHMVKGEIFIDDSPSNIMSYREAWPDSKILSIGYPFNKSVKSAVDLYASEYNKPKKCWNDFYKYINKLSR